MASMPPSPPPLPPSPLSSTIAEEDKASEMPYKHHPTPLHHTPASADQTARKPPRSGDNPFTVACNKCRPSAREKISIVPLDGSGHGRHSSLSPNILRSLFLSLTGKSPRSSTSSSSAAAAREEEWRLAAAELSRKLLHATRKRDEAVLESSRLKHSVAELERKLDKLESYCHDLKAALDTRPSPLAVEPFLRAVSDARSAVRHLSRALLSHVRHGAAGPHALARVAALLGTPREAGAQGMVFYMEAMLNRVFYGEYEEEGPGAAALDPVARCEANRAECEAVRGVGWEEVLSKGTRHYSEGLSRFCDRRMSEVVGALGWARAWPEQLLQAFFGAAKGAWVVHLLGRSVHPVVPMLRVDRGARFEPGYMEHVIGGGDGGGRPAGVRVMVAPGFYVYSGSTCGVVKCKVLCSYGGVSVTGGNGGGTATTSNSSNNNNSSCKDGNSQQ